MKTFWTKAKITEKQLFWHFGVALGFINATVKSLEDLEKELDRLYSAKEIRAMLFKTIPQD
jgi:hypothetical protein